MGPSGFLLVGLAVGFGLGMCAARRHWYSTSLGPASDADASLAPASEHSSPRARFTQGERTAMIDHAPAAVALFDRELRYLACSDRWLSDYGLERADTIGRLHYEVFPEIEDRWKQVHARCLAGAVERCEEDSFLRGDGTRQWLRWEVRPWFERDGIGGIAMYSEDITQRVEMERKRAASEAWFRSVVDATVMTGIVAAELDGIITLFNPGAEKLLGYTADEVVGRERPAIWHLPEEVDAFAAEMSQVLGRPVSGFEGMLEATRGGGIPRREWTFRRKDGSTFPASLRTSLVRTPAGDVAGYLGVFEDVSAQRAEEKRLRDHSLALEQARQSAVEAARAKTEFLANMSHEIRTPMTAILGFADCLLEDELPKSEQQDLLRTIRRNGDFLIDIINNILDLSKIEAGQMEVERDGVAPRQLVEDVLALFRARAESKGLRLEQQCASNIPDLVYTDSTRLRQILVNLVGNAIKFTMEGSVSIHVARSVDATREATLRVDVIDTGIGISESQRQRLFAPFSQADASTTRQYGGTGLGLVLSQRLAHLLGGQIELESTPDQGSRFTLELPMGLDQGTTASCTERREDSSEAREHAVESRGLEGLSILLAEDGADNQRLIAHVLRRAGATVEVVADGRAAVRAALDQPFDAALMDMQMPIMDGYEATRELRDAGLELPIVALTAHALVGDRERCIRAGCSDYCTKPIDRRELCEKIRSVVDARRKPLTGGTADT